MALGGVSATTLAVSASDSSREAKKGALKAVGAMLLTAAGMDAFYTYNGMAVSVPGWAGRVGRVGGQQVAASRRCQPCATCRRINTPHFCQTNPIFAIPNGPCRRRRPTLPLRQPTRHWACCASGAASRRTAAAAALLSEGRGRPAGGPMGVVGTDGTCEQN